MYSLEEDKEKQFSLVGPTQLSAPSEPVAQERAAMAHYAMGETSPGEEVIFRTIADGGEKNIRSMMAADEDLAREKQKLDIMDTLARRRGGALHPDEKALIEGLSAADLRSDPGSILEKKFADKYVSDVMNVYGQAWERIQTPVDQVEGDVVADLIKRQRFFVTRAQDLDKEMEQQSTISKIADFGGQLIPFLPWVRQMDAVQRPGIEWLPGKTVAENVRYILSIPDYNEMVAVYDKALTYLKGKNMLDAALFSQAMVAFPYSDEFLGNLVGIADYATGASSIAKAFLRSKAALPALAGNKNINAYQNPIGPLRPGFDGPQGPIRPGFEGPQGPMKPGFSEPQGPKPDTSLKSFEYDERGRMDDLFGARPGEQGSFRFMDQAEQTRPPTDAELPGRLRGTYLPEKGRVGSGTGDKSFQGPYRDALGRTRRKSEEPELPFGTSEQGTLRLGGGSSDAPIQGPQQPWWQLKSDPMQGPSIPLTPMKGEKLPPRQTVPPPTPETEPIRKALADAAKGLEGPSIMPERAAAAMGDIPRASYIGALERLVNKATGGLPNVSRELPSIANPGSFFQGAESLSRSRAQALATLATEETKKLFAGLTRSLRPARTTQEALAIGIRNAEQALQKEYGSRLHAGILDVVHLPAEKHPANVDSVYMILGDLDKTLFSSPERAKMFAKDIYELGTQEASVVEQQGRGWFIALSQPVVEADASVRAGLMSKNNVTSYGPIKMLLSRVMSAAGILPEFQRGNRSLATHGMQEFRTVAKEVVEEVFTKGLTRTETRALNDVLRVFANTPNPRDPSTPGIFPTTATEFAQAFVDRHKRLPTEAESRAYDSFVRLNDVEFVALTQSVYRDRFIKGVQEWRAKLGDQETGWFAGKPHDTMPWDIGKKGDQDATIWVMDTKTGSHKFSYKYDLTDAQRAEIDDMVANKGFRVIQIYDPETHPFKGMAKTAAGDDLSESINYVITNAAEKRPLSWQQVKYSPGGHLIYEGQWYVAGLVIKPGRKGKMTYYGDNPVMNFHTEAQAKKFSDRVEYGRQLLVKGQTQDLEAYLAANLPHTPEQFMKLFYGPNAPLLLDQPVSYKKAGAHAIDTVPRHLSEIEEGVLVDGRKNVHDLSAAEDKTFLSERDLLLSTVREDGGIMKLAPADRLDPFVALNEGMSHALRNTWLNDYRMGAIESLFKEFGDLMDVSEKTLWSHPMHFLHNPQWKQGVADQARLEAAKATQRAILQFMGQHTELGRAMNFIGNKLMDSIYNASGQGGVDVLNRIGQWTDRVGLANIKDPVAFLRAAAFHPTMGFFNPAQFLVQYSQAGVVWAIAGPKNGTAGLAASWAARALAHNPAHLDAVADKMKAFGWKKNDFKDMVTDLRDSGIMRVGGEATVRDDVMDPHMFRSTTGWVLDKGAMFFNEGERMVRIAAYAVAWREWKAANAGMKLDARAAGQVQDRYRTLSGDMTRDANAGWQSGVLSVPTQFWAYTARITEQMLGPRLTGVEKLRVFATMSAMYGVPVGAGMFTAGISPLSPLGIPTAYEDVMQEATKRGIDLNPAYMKILSQGILQYAMFLATGRESNVTERFAPSASNPIRDLLYKDQSWLSLLGGISGTIIGDALKTATPFEYWASSILMGKDEQYPIKATDFMNLFRNIKTVDIGAKMYGVTQYGVWRTKSGLDVTDRVTNVDAALALLGLSPIDASNAFLAKDALLGQSKHQKTFERSATEDFRLGLQAAKNGDYAGMNDYFARAKAAMIAGGFKEDEKNRIFQRIVRENRTLADSVRWDLVNKATQDNYRGSFDKYFKDMRK